MKTFVFSGILSFIIMGGFSSCEKWFYHDPVFVNYWLNLNFRDASGNDMVKGIELSEWWPANVPKEEAHSGSVAPDSYKLDIILPHPCRDWDNDIYNFRRRPGVIRDVNYPQLGWGDSDDGSFYLSTHLGIPAGDCPVTKKLTYKLKCPYLFGDDAIHEIVTYWDVPKIRGRSVYPKCNRIEFEGGVITQITHLQSWNTSVATIILAGREKP